MGTRLLVDILKSAATHIFRDEIIVEAREGIVGDMAIIVKECMDLTFSEIFPEVPFVVLPKVRDSWG